MEAIVALILFTILFLCAALFNSHFFPPPNFLPWLHSLCAGSSSPNLPTPSSQTNRKQQRGESELETVFSTFDSNGDGFISKGELAESLRRLGMETSGGDVGIMMEKVDRNGDGLIDLEEFRELCLSWGEVSGGGGEEDEEGLREAFDVFDGNRDGLITVEELRLVLKSMGMKEGEKAEACRDMIKKVDMDGDGMVSFQEFKRMMVLNQGKIIF